MARQGITFDQVKNAADAIQARSLEPTIAAVRAELGSGSFSTISQHLSRWKSERIDAAPAARNMPEELEDKLLEMGAAFFNAVTRLSEQDVRAAKQEAADRIKEAHGETAAYKEEAEETHEKLVKALEEREEALMKLANAERRIAQLEAENKTRVELHKQLLAEIQGAKAIKPRGDTKPANQPQKAAESGSKPA